MSPLNACDLDMFYFSTRNISSVLCIKEATSFARASAYVGLTPEKKSSLLKMNPKNINAKLIKNPFF